jgi:hypothetical protein
LAAAVPVFIATPTSAWASGRVVGAVAGHRDQPAALLLLADQRHLVLGRGLGEEVVHPGLRGDRLRGQGVVAGDHDRADAHRAHLGEPLGHPGLDHVGQRDDAERAPHAPHALRDDERCAAAGADPVDGRGDLGRQRHGPQPSRDRGARALAHLAAAVIRRRGAATRGARGGSASSGSVTVQP